MNKLIFALSFAFLSITGLTAFAQDATQQPSPAASPTTEESEKQKAEREKNAYRLLDQVVDEAQSLRLAENRVRVQITAADLYWDRNQGKARTLFAQAADGVVELSKIEPTRNQRGVAPPDRRAIQLRQELLMTVARHDAQLAYQLLAATKPATPAQTNPTGNGPFAPIASEDNLEQALLGRVAALDPKLASQNAEQMMEKGQFPRSLPEVIYQLQKQDAEAAAKLIDKTVKKIQATNILTANDAGTLAQLLLIPGPRLAANSTTSQPTGQQTTARGPLLDQSIYTDLLSSVVDAALKATPQPQNTQRQGNFRRPGVQAGVGPGQNNQSQATDAQIEQANARRLLSGLQTTLPMIDQYLPAKASLVRQKLAELGVSDGSRQNLAQNLSALQGNATTDALMQAATTAPPQLQSRLYQMAANKAIEEGNTDRARQIANDHLQAGVRDSVMQRIDFRELAKKADGARIEEIRQTLARLPSDNERIDLLITMAKDLQTSNPKSALQFLEEAKQITNRRATNYDQFEQQITVADAFAAVDVARSFEILEPGIAQLNELLSAAAVLSGFEMNLFRDGEMSMQNGSGLSSTVNRFGQELATLAKTDFERSDTLAGRFQFAEPRIMARLAIVQGLLGRTNQQINVFRTPGQPIIRID